MSRYLPLLLLVTMLTACAGQGPMTGERGPVHSRFSQTLESEYSALADFEGQSAPDSRLADYFKSKAAKAQMGDAPLPDDPATAKLPDTGKAEVVRAHHQLMQSLQAGDWIENGPLLAMAQTRFDCWLALQAMEGKPDSGYGCRQKFEEAMDLAAQAAHPVPQQATYTVLFDPDAIAINEQNMDAVRQAARSVRAQPGWAAVLNGYTDMKEKQETSRALSMRRAMSVRNALAEQGVPLTVIRVNAFGHAPEGASGQPEQERRVDIEVMPEAQAAAMKSSKIEAAMPESFGSLKPVF